MTLGSLYIRLSEGKMAWSALGQQTLGGNQFPCSLDVKTEVIIADLSEFDADPTAMAHIRWIEKSFGVGLDEGRLDARQGGKINGNMTIVVVIVDEHDEYSSVDEKGGFAVGKFFGGVGEGETETADAFDLGFAHRGAFIPDKFRV